MVNVMSCEICGRGNCTRSFHSLEEQNDYDDVADTIKERMRNHLLYKVSRIKDVQNIDGKDYIQLDEVNDIINYY